MKEVDFTYCLKCSHWKKGEAEDPCHECLNNPSREYSHMPLYYDEDPAKAKNDSHPKHGA